jgi:hypothetical protein
MKDFDSEMPISLLEMMDCDGDSVSVQEMSDDRFMLRIENDEVITGIIIDAPIAMALVGVLLPMIRNFKMDEFINEIEAACRES